VWQKHSQKELRLGEKFVCREQPSANTKERQILLRRHVVKKWSEFGELLKTERHGLPFTMRSPYYKKSQPFPVSAVSHALNGCKRFWIS
jgi:hypothetical protein